MTVKVPQNVLDAVYGSTAADWHQHPNGRGWVYKTAKVEESAYLHPMLVVFGNARVLGYAWTQSPPYIQGSRHALTLCSHTQIAVGCHVHTIAEWKKTYKAVGKAEGYTPEQIAEYGRHIAYIAKEAKILVAVKK